jgi:hypothetical protein
MRTAMRTDEPLQYDNALSAYGRARSTVEGAPLSPDELRKIDEYWGSGVFERAHPARARCVGSASNPPGGATFCWAPPVSASLDTSTTSPSRQSGCGTTPVIWIEREHDHS